MVALAQQNIAQPQLQVKSSVSKSHLISHLSTYVLFFFFFVSRTGTIAIGNALFLLYCVFSSDSVSISHNSIMVAASVPFR
jgi:hypothetical protein